MSKKTAITPTRDQNFPEWYQDVIKKSKLAENSSTRGCMIILPLGYAIWENMQKHLDGEFKRLGTQNVYFPLLIPLALLEKEAEHVEGFAKECAVVTHRRLSEKDGKLVPDAELAEPYVIRPTSEMVIGEAFSRWVNSYRDLPIIINQWANVMRWEMRPRIFLRTAEFLWQEGHTVHSTKEEAQQKANDMLEVYRSFIEETLAIPVIRGEKSESEKFPGADTTYTVESMMQDGKALQSGTSHYLGQNFAKAQNIKFINNEEKEVYAYTTSWGVTTRLIGALIMSHSDDNGLVLPPKIADTQITFIPVFRKEEQKEEILNYINTLKAQIESQNFNGKSIKVHVDLTEQRGGEKYWRQVKVGTPLIAEVGPRDMEKNSVFLSRRDNISEKSAMNKDELVNDISSLLSDIQDNLFSTAKDRFENNIHEVESLEQFRKLFKKNSDKMIHPMAKMYLDDNEKTLEILGQHQASIRCYPIDEKEVEGKTCVLSGNKATRKAIVARSY